MNIRVIRNEDDLTAALKQIDRLWNAEPGTEAGDKLDDIAGFIVGSYHHDPELMKVIIIEVTRAANSFGATHLPEIRRAYDVVAKIVRDAQGEGLYRAEVDPDFVAMWFYGAIEQLLSGWVFGLMPATDEEFDRARAMVVETLCLGLERRDRG